jgi:hypothetical protein
VQEKGEMRCEESKLIHAIAKIFLYNVRSKECALDE